jgi:hypothetical protein
LDGGVAAGPPKCNASGQGPRAEERIMNVELSAEEADLLRRLLLAEVEGKRVEIHHSQNLDYKAELQKQEKTIQAVLKRLG